jgi:hypothetical protein
MTGDKAIGRRIRKGKHSVSFDLEEEIWFQRHSISTPFVNSDIEFLKFFLLQSVKASGLYKVWSSDSL